MLPLKSLGTLVCFVLQSVSSTLKKFHAFSPCQVFMVLSDALGGCVIVFSFRFPPNLVMLSAYLAHDCVVEAFQNDYFYSPPSGIQMCPYSHARKSKLCRCHRKSHIVLDGDSLIM